MTRRKWRRSTARTARGLHWTAMVGGLETGEPVAGSSTFWIPLLGDQTVPEPAQASTTPVTVERVVIEYRLWPQLTTPLVTLAAGQYWNKLFTVGLCIGPEDYAEGSSPRWNEVRHDNAVIDMRDSLWFEGGVDTLWRKMVSTTLGPGWTSGEYTVFALQGNDAVHSADVRVKRRFNQSQGLYLVVDPDPDTFSGRAFNLELNARILYRR